MSDNETRRILEERARHLARSTSRAAQAEFGVDMLIFALGRERFAVESRYVFAAFPLAELVPLPGATSPVVGLTRWRGDLLTVADIRRLIGLTPGALDDLSRVIVVGDGSPELGILADTLSDIVSIDPTQLHAPTHAHAHSLQQTGHHPTGNDRRTDAPTLVRGVTTDAISVIDVAALLARQAESAPLADPSPLSPSSSDP